MTHRVLNIHKVKGIIHLLLSLCLLLFSTLFVLTQPMHVLHHWQSIARMFPQNHCDYEEDGFIGFSSWRHYICICIILLALWMLRTLCVTYMKLGKKKQSCQKKKVEVKYEIFLQWNTRRFLQFGSYKFWILLKLYNPRDFAAEIQLKL